ncbi:hypothetical protein GYMLUDRAFT_61355 [Collybiopsis luxurians FD-317 M1]|uniref:Coatomer WD associated region domain-containing protein n=1 Tax=Collybiopsis luxurians FD-317 M1 TaxID=944289 RepID=A0A0D0BQE9_9AGAR|nr:hypothetical protein GYMLUDRAFT_61355 [Collybiopsis luxurians FD-317 M1]
MKSFFCSREGSLLGARGNGFVIFWDWEMGDIVRRVDVDEKNICWSTTNSRVAIIADDPFYILRFDRDAFEKKQAKWVENFNEGVEEAFEVIAEVSEAPLYLLSYLPAQTRTYLTDLNVRIEMEEAVNIFSEDRKAGLALKTGHRLDYKFELALQLDDLEIALDIVCAEAEGVSKSAAISTEINLESITKWKSLGERALTAWRSDPAKECFENAGNLGVLMLLLMSMGGQDEILKLAERAEREGQSNLAWSIWWTTGERKRCVELLIKIGRESEAALFARTYSRSLGPKTVISWQSELKTKDRPKTAETIANPDVKPAIFEKGWEVINEKARGETPQTEPPVLVDVDA